MSTGLWPHQERGLGLIRDAYRRGKRSICAVLATGGGKTRLGAELVKGHVGKGGKVLWLAHRIELVEQAAARLRRDGLERVGVIAATSADVDPEAPVQVASVQTVIARDLRPKGSLLIFDECHHAPAAEYRRVAERYQLRVGLTATPARGDGKPLGDIFDDLVVIAQPRELVEAGHLVDVDVVAPKRLRAGEIAGSPVRQYLEHASGRRAFVFAADTAHATDLCAEFNAAGVPAAAILGTTHPDERAEAIEMFRRGELLALCNCFVLTEGTDVPEAEVCILASGAGTPSTYIQKVGRVLRVAPGKERALVLDLAGASRRHGHPLADREYSLEGKAISWKGRPKRAGRPKQIEAALHRVSAHDPAAAEKVASLRDLQALAAERGFKPGWAVHAFKRRYGHLPWEAAS